MNKMTTLFSVVLMGLSTTAFAVESESLVADLNLSLDSTSDSPDVAHRSGRSSANRGRSRGASRSTARKTSSSRSTPARSNRTSNKRTASSTGRQVPARTTTSTRNSTTRNASTTTTRASRAQTPVRGVRTGTRSQTVTQVRNGNTRTGVRTTTRAQSTRPVAVRSNRTSVVRGRTVVRPATRAIIRPGRTTVVRPRARYSSYRTVRPYHGVFVYGPRPTTHVHYSGGGGGGNVRVEKNHLPSRAVDRGNSLAVGLTMGTLHSGFKNTGGYGDLGIGLAARYRPVESLGLQVDLKHHGAATDNLASRNQTHLAASAQLFAFPWTRVQPYVSLGVTGMARDIEQEVSNLDGTTSSISQHDSALGLHGGLGVELALGKSVALDFEARYVGMMGQSLEAETLPGAITTTGGLMFHF